MKTGIFILTFVVVFVVVAYFLFRGKGKKVQDPNRSISDFSVKNIKGNQIELSKYQGKVVLIVNTASKCGFTPQFEGLEALYNQYKEKEFIVLGFPCNQFLKQDPGSDAEIQEFCQVNYGVSFPMFHKIDINGKDAHPLYEYLKGSVPNKKYKNISWNFTKFLIGKDGKTVKRYSPTTEPKDIEKDILAELEK